MDVYVYMMRVDDALTDQEENELLHRLSQTRQEKIKKLRYQADKRLSLGAGLLLDYGLRFFGIREQQETFGTIGNGKPCLLHHPQIQFNLSHSGNMAMAAFSCLSDQEYAAGKDADLGQIGCDVERKQKARMDVAKRFFAPAEQRVLLSAETEAERDLLFSRLWTLKESYIKADGRGMALPLDSFVVELGGQPRLLGKAGAQYRFQEFALTDYCASVCVRQQDAAKRATFFFSFQNLQDMV